MPDIPINFRNWKRITPRPRSEDFRRAYQAQVRDPLWFLARQWQLGEFKGEDAASPFWVRFSARCVDLNSVADKKSGAKIGYDVTKDPLLKKVEQEHVLRADLTTRTDIGQHFEKLLTRNFEQANFRSRLIAAYRSAYSVPRIPKT